MTRRFISRLGVGVSVAAIVLSLSASAVLAGEITGNGESLKLPNDDPGKWGTYLHARSECAYSGQEDLQFEAGGSKGDPGHAQSWGQIPKYGDPTTLEPEGRDELTAFGFNPGNACNPIKAGGGEEP